MRRRLITIVAISLAGGAAVLAGVFGHLRATEREFLHEATLARQQANRIHSGVVLYTEEPIGTGLTFSQSLSRVGVEPVAIAGIISSAEGVFDLSHIRAGNRLQIGRSIKGALRSIRYQIDGVRVLSIVASENKPTSDGITPTFNAVVHSVQLQTESAVVTGEIHDSLFNAVERAGETPELAMRLADIFGWDLDFYTDTRQGDTFRVVVQKKTYVDGKSAGYGQILAAEYVNSGRPYTAVLFHDAAGAPAYYSADGNSLQKAFLRSPLKFAAPITSHFSQSRFHPILKQYRPHLGIDYAAPTGTPVQAIGAGHVIFAGPKGGAGNLVQIQHLNGYETMYMHLSRILVHAGQHVEPGDRIGLVGMTGLATGPHLDFRLMDHGVYRNFETLRLHLPPSEPVANSELADFFAARDSAFAKLNNTHLDARSVNVSPASMLSGR